MRRESLSSTQGPQSLVKLMAGACMLMAGLVALSWLATNPLDENPIGVIARAPASLVGLAIAPQRTAPPLLERTSTLEFECKPPESASVSGDIRQLRVKGRLCGSAP